MSEGAVLFCTSTNWHYLENLSYQPHAKLSGMQKFQWGHFLDQMTECDYGRVWRAKGLNTKKEKLTVIEGT